MKEERNKEGRKERKKERRKKEHLLLINYVINK